MTRPSATLTPHSELRIPNLPMINHARLLGRFLRYVQIDTTAGDGASTYPSSPGQLVLGKLLADELREMGLSDVEHDAHGLVWATVPATVEAHAAPVVAFNAHVDTSPETTGKNVKPQVIRNYAGGDIALPGDPTQGDPRGRQPRADAAASARRSSPPTARRCSGADDKAGVAVIMELAHTLDRASADSARPGPHPASPATKRSATASTTSI